MRNRVRDTIHNYTEDPVKVREQERIDWKAGTITYWDDEKGRGYIQPIKANEQSPYDKGWYYFTYVTLDEAKYTPVVGAEVLFRLRRAGLHQIAEIMEVQNETK